MPFDNGFATIPVTGAELARAVAANLGRDNGILSVSGVRGTPPASAARSTSRLTRADGKPIAPRDKLTLVTSDFLATGGDGLFSDEVRARAVLDDGPPIRDAMADELRARKAPLRPDEPALYDPARPASRLSRPPPHALRRTVKRRRETAAMISNVMALAPGRRRGGHPARPDDDEGPLHRGGPRPRRHLHPPAV